MTDGFGSNCRGATKLLDMGGQIVVGRYRHVRTTTSNLGLLVGFWKACEWALYDPRCQGRTIVLRYEEEYAARVG